MWLYDHVLTIGCWVKDHCGTLRRGTLSNYSTYSTLLYIMLYQYQRYTTPEGLSFIQVAISFSFSVGVSQFPFLQHLLATGLRHQGSSDTGGWDSYLGCGHQKLPLPNLQCLRLDVIFSTLVLKALIIGDINLLIDLRCWMYWNLIGHVDMSMWLWPNMRLLEIIGSRFKWYDIPPICLYFASGACQTLYASDQASWLSSFQQGSTTKLDVGGYSMSILFVADRIAGTRWD